MTDQREKPISSRRAFLSASAAVAATPVLGARAAHAAGHGLHSQSPDRQLRALLREIDPNRIGAIVTRLAAFGTRHTLSAQDDPARGIGAARDWIFEQLTAYAARSGGRMTVELQSFIQPVSPRVPVPTRVTNVVATLRGDTDPGRVYVVTGHYDSRATDVLDATSDAPGADDDASGVAAIMELARVMATRHTEATVVFAAVAGEEQGLYGSDHFAQFAKDSGWNVQGDLNMDISGSSNGGNGVHDGHEIRLFSEGVPTTETPQQAATRQSVGGENDGVSRQLARYIKETGENDATDMGVHLIWRRDRYLRSSDHVSFLLRGYPAVRFTEPNENYDHEHQDVRVENGVQFGDLPQFVDFQFLARVTRLIASSLIALARSPRPLVNTRVLSNTLTYDSQLRWNADPEPDVVGYEVVWRDSTDALWTHSRFVGDVTDYTLVGVNKDDFQVGVRAVDRDGNKSPVAFAGPANR
jgi:hypothetical protein